MKTPHTNSANKYARDVVAGKVTAGRWVKLAAQRHLDDLQRAKGGRWTYRVDRARVEHVCAFLQALPHVRGRWASEGQRLTLEPWQRFVIMSLYGWVHRETGARRYRTGYLEVGRKNGKSLMAAGLCLDGLLADGEHGAEVFAAANGERQSMIVFRTAQMMAERTPGLLGETGAEVCAKSISVASTGSRLEPCVRRPGEGSNPHLVILDELHESDDDTLLTTFQTGMAARVEPLLLAITTAGTDTSGPCFALRQRVEKVLDGTHEDDRLWGCVYAADEGVEWTSEEALLQANPNMGISVDSEWLVAEQADAARDPRLENRFRRAHLDQWMSAASGWLLAEVWNRQADASLRLEDFRGEKCWIGVDLASWADLTAVVHLFRRQVEGQPHYYVFNRNYCPEACVWESDAYQAWEKERRLISTPGASLDHKRVIDDILRDRDHFNIVRVAHDRYLALPMVQELTEARVETVAIPMTTGYLSTAMKQLDACLRDGRLHHPDDPLLTWQILNVECKPDHNDNLFPRRPKDRSAKIDSAVAALLAFYCAESMPETQPAPLGVYAF